MTRGTTSGHSGYHPSSNSDERLFISWIQHHGRSADLAENLPAHAAFVSGGTGNRLIRYARQWRETTDLIRRTNPSILFVMQPPVLALWAAHFTSRNDALVIADLHTGAFSDPKWSWASGGILRSLRRRGGAAIVTNDSLARRCRAAGVKTFVLDDAVPRLVGTAPAVPDERGLADLQIDAFVLVPLAYAADEPLDEILNAAAADSGRTWVLTGRAPEKLRNRAPDNVHFTGFVSNTDYRWLAAHAGVVLACTTEEDTMQRAGYEAVCWGRPLVTSRTRVLVDYFSDAAEFADPTSASLLDAVRQAFTVREKLIERIHHLGERKRVEYDAALERVRAFVAGVTRGRD